MIFVTAKHSLSIKVSEVWTPEGGLVTAAMKLKRKSIEIAFQVLYFDVDYSVGIILYFCLFKKKISEIKLLRRMTNDYTVQW